MTKPMTIGLTGSIGMGKSTVAAMFEAEGVPVFDADAEVREMQGPDGELLETIEEQFPGSTGTEGVLRDKLGAQVFSDAAALARLEAIVHPAVSARRADFFARHGDASLVVFDVPLLFERGGHEARRNSLTFFRCSFPTPTSAPVPTTLSTLVSRSKKPLRTSAPLSLICPLACGVRDHLQTRAQAPIVLCNA